MSHCIMGLNLRTRGFMFILSSPSGGGKTTIAKRLLQFDDRLRVSVSVTTRKPRLGEEHGADYFFMSVDEFRVKRHQNYFLECAKVFDNYYGTPRDFIERNINAGYDMLFDIDWQGTIQLTQNARNDVVSVFILPPSMEELRNRLSGRGTDSDEVVSDRMRRAKNEINHWYGYDYVIVNNSIDQCVEDVMNVLNAERLKRIRQNNLHHFVEGLFGC